MLHERPARALPSRCARVGHYGEGSSVTNRQRQIAFRVIGTAACGAAGSSAVAAHDGYIVFGFVLGLLSAFMAVAEVMNRKHAREQAEHEAIIASIRVMDAAMRGVKPEPPGVEYIREGSDPAERP